MDTQRGHFPLPAMCSALSVSPSGYRAWRRGGTPHRQRLTDAQLLALLRAIHAELKGAYGSPRMLAELRARGFSVGKARVERLMREQGIRARHKRRYKATTDSKHALPVADNRLNRHFTPTAPNQVWTADMTYLWTAEGWLYLAVVLDLFNREVVGWSIKPRMTADLVVEPLTMPWLLAPRVTAASPVMTATRAWMLGPRTVTPETSSSAARTARSASSSWATGVPHTAMTASPMNFSTIPP